MAAGLKTRKQSMEVRDSAVFSFADYLQLACMTRRSVQLSAIKDGRTLGGVIILTGEVWHAWDETGDGTEAFKRLALIECEVSVMPHTGDEPERTVEGSWERLMMDAAVEQDELSRSLPPPAPGSELAPAVSGVRAVTAEPEPQESKSGPAADEINTPISRAVDGGVVDARETPAEEASIVAFATTAPPPLPAPVPKQALASSQPRAQPTFAPPLARPSIVVRARVVAFRVRWFALSAAALLGFGIGWNQLSRPASPQGPVIVVGTAPPAIAAEVVAPQPTVVAPQLEPPTVQTPPGREIASPAVVSPSTVEGPVAEKLVVEEPVSKPQLAKRQKATAVSKRPRRRFKRSASSGKKKTIAKSFRKNSLPAAPATTLAPEPKIELLPTPPTASPASTPGVLSRNTPAPTKSASSTAPAHKSLKAKPASTSSTSKKTTKQPATSKPPAQKATPISSARPKPTPKSNARLRAQTRILGFRIVGPPSSDKLLNAVTRGRRKFTQCYRKAAMAAGRNGYGKVHVQVTVDGRGHVSGPRATGGLLPGLNRCVATVAGQLRTRRRTGVGRLQLKWTLSYVP